MLLASFDLSLRDIDRRLTRFNAVTSVSPRFHRPSLSLTPSLSFSFSSSPKGLPSLSFLCASSLVRSPPSFFISFTRRSLLFAISLSVCRSLSLFRSLFLSYVSLFLTLARLFYEIVSKKLRGSEAANWPAMFCSLLVTLVVEFIRSLSSSRCFCVFDFLFLRLSLSLSLSLSLPFSLCLDTSINLCPQHLRISGCVKCPAVICSFHLNHVVGSILLVCLDLNLPSGIASRSNSGGCVGNQQHLILLCTSTLVSPLFNDHLSLYASLSVLSKVFALTFVFWLLSLWYDQRHLFAFLSPEVLFSLLSAPLSLSPSLAFYPTSLSLRLLARLLYQSASRTAA